jgi:hypothetical protein
MMLTGLKSKAMLLCIAMTHARHGGLLSARSPTARADSLLCKGQPETSQDARSSEFALNNSFSLHDHLVVNSSQHRSFSAKGS